LRIADWEFEIADWLPALPAAFFFQSVNQSAIRNPAIRHQQSAIDNLQTAIDRVPLTNCTHC
jgi:hypothetical protein